ncbi:CLUMA_CG002700, isoform A [Clunio marinus]|uniref:CLUMA_CG002700, isoform A n=1 Tax=Clunio marinus TaxID=568069 RepID=A0A1J1HM24_9DIPT|nr:CLUMA_CG002700, isoform A [Clunio marinus]
MLSPEKPFQLPFSFVKNETKIFSDHRFSDFMTHSKIIIIKSVCSLFCSVFLRLFLANSYEPQISMKWRGRKIVFYFRLDRVVMRIIYMPHWVKYLRTENTFEANKTSLMYLDVTAPHYLAE